jgi:mono/diheme cytochrome c family protein
MKKYILGFALIGLSFNAFSQDANKGKKVYTQTCIACHQATGAGIPGAFPPLAKSDYLNADVNRAIKQVIKGSNGPITVNGKKYTTPMPAQALSDQQIADVLTYVYANWGNSKKVVTLAMVKAQRK